MVVHRYLRRCYANLGLNPTDDYIDLLDKVMYRFLAHTYYSSSDEMLSFISDNMNRKVSQKILNQIMTNAETPFSQRTIRHWLVKHGATNTTIKAKYYSYVFLYIFERMTIKLRDYELTEKNLVRVMAKSLTFYWLLP